jgi:glycyl-tRNA synthetase
VLPLSKKETLTPTAREVLKLLQPHFMCDYDETQSIGRRYRRQDEAGTPYCVTVDFETLDDRAVTIRDRDSLAQERVPVDGLVEELRARLEG